MDWKKKPKMICRLCLKEVESFIEIYGEAGTRLNIAQIVQKYFDLELKSEDDTSKVICTDCWVMVSQFHEFYLVIEEAQRKFKDATPNVFTPEMVFIKSEPCENKVEFEEDTAEDIFKDYSVENADDGENTGSIDSIKGGPRRSMRNRQNDKDTISPQLKNKNTTKKKEKVEEKKEKEKKGQKAVKKTLSKLNEGDAKVAAHMELICEICQEKAPTFTKLRNHMKEKHKLKGYVRCCNKKIFERITLLEHIETHVNPDYLRCTICDKNFSDRRCYEQHMLLKHAAEEEKTYRCDMCPRRFAKSFLLARHQVLHGERKYICEDCHKAFPTKSQLNTHVKLKHLNKGIMCEICAKVLIGRAAFDIHQKEHQGVPIPKVQCTLCGSWHKNKNNLLKHMRTHNEDGIEYICNICEKKAPNRNALIAHKRYVHEAKRTHECKICNKSFKRSITLKEHMSLHTGEVLYNCPHCSRTFICRANMYAHRKKAHPLEFEETRRQRLEEAAQPTTGKKMPTLLEISKPT